MQAVQVRAREALVDGANVLQFEMVGRQASRSVVRE
jgi:hypothetical protein